MITQIRLHSVAYHRNGICGEGFFVVTFTCRVDGRRRNMVATAFMEADESLNEKIAILDADMAARGNIKFGENSWRYEDFAGEIKSWIADYRQRLAA